MARKYLVPCDCGNQVPATVHQAGSQIACSCGKQVDVPPLRKLRELPPADELPADTAAKWSPRHAVAVGGASMVLGLLLLAGYMWSTEPDIPTFDEGHYAENVDGLLANGTPLQFWQHWRSIDRKLSEDGFEEFTSPQVESIKAYIAQQQLRRNVVLGIAGVVAVATVVAVVAWPGPSRT